MKNEKGNIGVIIIGDHVQALGIIRSLGRRGIPVYLLYDKNLCISRFSRYTKRYIKTPSVSDEPKFVDFMLKLAKNEQLKDWILMPTNDTAVYTLSKHKETLEEYYSVPTPHLDTVEQAYNKKLTYQVAEKNGITIPKTFYPANLDELHEIAADLDYPVIIKPAIIDLFYKKTKTKVFVANTKEELIQAYKKASLIIDSSQILVQEVIPGGPEFVYSFCSFYKNGELLAYFFKKIIRQRPMDFGKGSTCVESAFVPELIMPSKRLLDAIKYYGLSEIEFKKDPRDGKFKLLEMNPRTWQSHSLAIRCGIDFPYLLYQDIMDGAVTPVTSVRENVKWIHFYTDIGVIAKEVLNGKMSLKDYVASLKGEKEFAVFSLSDPKPFIAETLILPYLWVVR